VLPLPLLPLLLLLEAETMRSTGGCAMSSRDAKVAERLTRDPLTISNVTAPPVFAATCDVTSYSTHVPALAVVTLAEPILVPAGGASFQVIVVSPQLSAPAVK
jgi:hypothetical protein